MPVRHSECRMGSPSRLRLSSRAVGPMIMGLFPFIAISFCPILPRLRATRSPRGSSTRPQSDCGTPPQWRRLGSRIEYKTCLTSCRLRPRRTGMRRSRWNASISSKTPRKPSGGSASSTRCGKSCSFARPVIWSLRRVISSNPPRLRASPPHAPGSLSPGRGTHGQIIDLELRHLAENVLQFSSREGAQRLRAHVPKLAGAQSYRCHGHIIRRLDNCDGVILPERPEYVLHRRSGLLRHVLEGVRPLGAILEVPDPLLGEV